MKTTPEALKDLYVGLGGEAADVAEMSKTVDVLNAIAVKYEGEGDANVIPAAIENIAAVADNIGGGGVTPTGTKQITTNGTHDVTEYASAEVNVESDFSTCQVAIRTSGLSAESADVIIPYAQSYYNRAVGSVTAQGTSTTLTVILYKGKAIANFEVNNTYKFEVESGSATVDGNVVAIITGDCSLVIKPLIEEH